MVRPAVEHLGFEQCRLQQRGGRPALDCQTGGALATVEFLHPAGFATPLHVHHTADEAFYILAGGMRGICGDQEWQATTGSFVWLPRGIPHGYAVDGDEPLRTLAIALPGGFDRFIVEAGEPAGERTLPSPAAPDIAKLEAVGTKYGIENVGPPVQFARTPVAVSERMPAAHDFQRARPPL